MVLRTTAAAAVLVSAAVHLVMWLDFARGQDVIGPGFLMNAVGGVAIAALVLTWHHWLSGLLVAGFGLSTLGAFLMATTVGFFGARAGWGGWEPSVAAASEALAIVTGLLLVLRGRGSRSQVEAEHHATARRPDLH